MLLALFLPDPCDEHCPEDFKKKARELLPRLTGPVTEKDEDLRKALLKFIGDFANWDAAADRTFLEVGRDLVKAVYPEEPPLVVDPFAGGGSIPLEALRLGCETFASDLNPVACLILKTVLEDIPRHGPKLAEELRQVGTQIKQAAERELAELYPTDPDGAKPIAYLWARTVRCESPNCGAEIPLMRSFWLCKKRGRRWALRYRVTQTREEQHRIDFEVFKPASEHEVPPGTVKLAKATCLACNSVLAPERVRAQLRGQRGGADIVFDKSENRVGGARLLAVVILRSGEPGRQYRIAESRDYAAVRKACLALEQLSAEAAPWDYSALPNEPTPQDGTGSVGGGYRTRKYGIETFSDFFNARQKLGLLWLARAIQRLEGVHIRSILALALGKTVLQLNSECRWKATGESLMDAFGRQALPIVWDFAEASLISDSTGDFGVALDWICEVIGRQQVHGVGQVQVADACESPLPEQSATVWFTDPPYYDSVPYADLSDFFFVWLKRALFGSKVLSDPWDARNLLTPKAREAVRDEQEHLDGRPKKSTEWYERAMHRAFTEGRRVLREDGIGSVVFAHKTTEGWEALLSGMIRGSWTITGSWPIATEMGSRLRARESAALATSIHLVCRPRSEGAPVGDWGHVLRELPKRVSDWMERLQTEGVRGADLVFACIGPALEIFSRYSKVETAEGREVRLPEFLEKVWEVVGRTALEQVLGTAEVSARNGVAGALEEDARLTALFLWTLQSTNNVATNGVEEAQEEATSEDEDEEGDTSAAKRPGFSLVFDVVRRFAQPLGIHLPDWEGRIIETKKGVVRLLSVHERSEQLFGQDGADLVADRIEHAPTGGPLQLELFANRAEETAPKVKGPGRRRSGRLSAEVSDESLQTRREATTLDRVHAAMLLQASGRTNALRALLRAETERGPDFLRLANALSALYPTGSEEERLLDAMLLAVPR
jgi:adenine-specific DNA methylase